MPDLLKLIKAAKPTPVIVSRNNRRRPMDFPQDADDLSPEDLTLVLSIAAGEDNEGLFVGRRRLWHVKAMADGALVKSISHTAPASSLPPPTLTPVRGSVMAAVLSYAAMFLIGVAFGLIHARQPSAVSTKATPLESCAVLAHHDVPLRVLYPCQPKRRTTP